MLSWVLRLLVNMQCFKLQDQQGSALVARQNSQMIKVTPEDWRPRIKLPPSESQTHFYKELLCSSDEKKPAFWIWCHQVLPKYLHMIVYHFCLQPPSHKKILLDKRFGHRRCKNQKELIFGFPVIKSDPRRALAVSASISNKSVSTKCNIYVYISCVKYQSLNTSFYIILELFHFCIALI